VEPKGQSLQQYLLNSDMDKLELAGKNLGRVFDPKSGFMCAKHLCWHEAKLPDLSGVSTGEQTVNLSLAKTIAILER
jgi:hypothetical protein